MKTLHKYLNQRLSKKQMVNIKGGDIDCYIRYQDADGNYFDEKGTVAGAATIGEAANLMSKKYAAIGYEMSAIKCL